MHKQLLTSLLTALLAACQPQQAPDTEGGEQSAALSTSMTTGDGEQLLADIKTLASDAFGGRAPMSPGEQKTLDFIRQRFAALGIEPLFGDSYRQPVPLAAVTTAPEIGLQVSGMEGSVSFGYGDEVMLWSRRLESDIELADAGLVFAGYGIVAPEYDWNDYAGLDVRGKIAVVLVNDPGFASGDDNLFDGRAMTYYGRWTYKYDEAARQGAAGALIVHNTEAASYPWEVVKNSWSGPQFHLDRRELQDDTGQDDTGQDDTGLLMVEGWLTESAAARLFKLVGMNLEQAYGAVRERGFQGRPLPLAATTRLQQQIDYARSYNIGGLIRGRERPDEVLIYTAHWDHLGTDDSAPEGEDAIYNGAVDNATGVAALLALAESFARQPQPERSVAFLAVTAEESGLLGSAWYTANPPLPMAGHVAGINMDAMNVYGPTRDLTVVGYGQSEMEDYLRKYARLQERIVAPEERPEAGGYYRSDHFNFARRGVPMLYADSGSDHIEHGTAWMQEKQRRFTAERYHKPRDEVLDDWDLRGLQQDLWLFEQIGRELANSEVWPAWYEGSEFRQIREQSRR